MSDPKSQVRILRVAADEADQRIDNYLLRQLKGVPRSMIYRLVRKGQVRVNRGRIRPNYRLAAGDEVRIPPVRRPETAVAPVSPAAGAALKDRIIHEDERLLVVCKPAGMAVHGGSGVSTGVIETLRALRARTDFLELVHRLDRNTSGCLLLAKRRSALRHLHDQLRNDRVDKRYFALLRGRLSPDTVRVEAPLKKNQLRSGERMVRVTDAGKPARTDFRVVESYPGATLVEARLHTGRTHQIRVHAAHIGHPIAGDDKYGDDTFNHQLRERGLKRLFLHAHFLELTHPGSEERLQVSCPLEPALTAVLDRLAANPIV